MIYRHFPLINIHDRAQIAAEANEAAGVQGKFWEYHDTLYEQQAAFSNADDPQAFLVDLAGSLGLDTDRFQADLEDGTFTPYIEQMIQEAQQIGLPGTPALIVNGDLLPGTPPYEAWANYVETLQVLRSIEALQYDAAPPMTIDENAVYEATVTMASGERFVMELYPQSAPQTVNSFVFLAGEGWFDGVTFHRVEPGFVAQTGDPTATGLGGPGYQIPNEIDPDLSHREAGVVAMANSGPDTNGSQWYITLGDASFLDGSYTIFGRVVEGLEVVEGLTPRNAQVNPDAPTGDVIESIVVEEK